MLQCFWVEVAEKAEAYAPGSLTVRLIVQGQGCLSPTSVAATAAAAAGWAEAHSPCQAAAPAGIRSAAPRWTSPTGSARL